jgi:Ca2+-binding EF-hand superfamily protein
VIAFKEPERQGSSGRVLLRPLTQPKVKVALLEKTGTASAFETVASSKAGVPVSNFFCACSAPPAVSKYEKDSAMGHAIDALALTQKDLRKLRAVFDAVDTGTKGSILNREFMQHIEEKRSVYTDSLFRHLALEAFDEDEIGKEGEEGFGGSLAWEEFCRSVISFCAFTEEDVLTFVFHTHDHDHNGFIEPDEFLEIVRGVHDEKELTSADTDEITLESFDLNGDEKLGRKEFISINQRYPLVFFPAFRLQDRVRRRTLGLLRWQSVIKAFEAQQEKQRVEAELNEKCRRFSVQQQKNRAAELALQ